MVSKFSKYLFKLLEIAQKLAEYWQIIEISPNLVTLTNVNKKPFSLTLSAINNMKQWTLAHHRRKDFCTLVSRLTGLDLLNKKICYPERAGEKVENSFRDRVNAQSTNSLYITCFYWNYWFQTSKTGDQFYTDTAPLRWVLIGPGL